MHQKLRTVLLFAALAAMLSSCVQESRTIAVAGTGTVTFIPDMAVISVRVSNTNPRLNDSLLQTKNTISQIIEVCRAFQIASDDVKTSYVNTDKEYTNTGYDKPPVFAGYSATQTTQITYKDLANFEKFTEALLALRITSVEGVTFDHTKLAEFSSEADLLALDDASASAEKIAKRMNVKLGKVKFITNNDSDPGNRTNFAGNAFSKNLSSGIVASPGILSVTNHVSVIYDIE